MKKEILNLVCMNIKNSFTEDGKAAAEAITAALEALAGDENKEFGAEEVAEAAKKAVDDIFKSEESLPEEVANMMRKMTANAIEARIKEVTAVHNGVTKELPKEVRNQVAQAIIDCSDKTKLKDAVMGVIKANGISGLEFANVIDYTIVDKFENEDELYAALNVTPIDEWFYTTQQLSDKNITPKQWGDSKTGEKAIQAITTTPVKISTEYIYGRFETNNSLLARLRKKGSEAQFIAWVTNELRQLNHAMQIRAILLGDQVNDSGDKITVFEALKRSASDHVVTVSTATGDYASLSEARAARDNVRDNRAAIWAVMDRHQFTELAKFQYGEGGSWHYKSKEEVAGELNVEKVYLTDCVNAANGVLIEFITPSEYYVNRDEVLEVAYPDYKTNKQNWQYEEMTGGKIHGLGSCAVILAKPSTSVSGSASRSASASASASA